MSDPIFLSPRENFLPSQSARCLASLTIFIVTFLVIASSGDNSALKGDSDFIDKYTATKILREGLGERLYDLALQRKIQQDVLADLSSSIRFPGEVLLYTHPPFSVLWYLPVAGFSYTTAYLLWSVWNIAVLLVAMWLLMAHLDLHTRSYFGLAVLACLGYLPLMATLLQGQTTSIALLFLVLAFLDIRKMHDFRAGIWLSLILIKFQILPPFLILFFFKKRWKLLAGFLAGSLPLLLLSLYILGPGGLLGYFQLLIKMAGWTGVYGVNPTKALCLRGQVFLLLHSCCPIWIMPICIGINLSLLALLGWCWRGRWDVHDPAFNLKFALTTILSLLMAPHINFHDLTLMLPAGLLILHFTARDQEQARTKRFTLFVLIVVAYPILIINMPLSGLIPIQMVVLGFLFLSGLLVKQLFQLESVEG